MLSGEKSISMWDTSACHNPLGPPVNVWATGTVGQFVFLVHCVQFASVVSPGSLSL